MNSFLKLVSVLLLGVVSVLSVDTFAADSKGTVFITGANRGIGLALVRNFTDAGFNVIGTARKPESATELKETGARVEQLDVTDQASVDAMAQRMAETPVDILINNAGIKGDDSKDMASLDVENMEWVLIVNTLGPVRVMKALFPNVQSSERKMVVNISSTMGSIERNTWGCCAGYRASKTALNSINKTFAVDFGKQGVTFVVMHPGYVQTDMNEGKGNITPDQSGVGLMNVITGLDASDNGKFYDWEGNELPW
ncbi:MAG: SDR family oxidoreductase [Xanthomonadales bacterium]|nr:SDR family oxidoreductase [Xanthomonadales bacterium]